MPYSCNYPSSICYPRNSGCYSVNPIRGACIFDGSSGLGGDAGYIGGTSSGFAISAKRLGETANVGSTCCAQTPASVCEICPAPLALIVPGGAIAASDKTLEVAGTTACVGSFDGFGGYGNSGGYGNGGLRNYGLGGQRCFDSYYSNSFCKP